MASLSTSLSFQIIMIYHCECSSHGSLPIYLSIWTFLTSLCVGPLLDSVQIQPLSLFQYTKLYTNNTPSSFNYFLITVDWHTLSKTPWYGIFSNNWWYIFSSPWEQQGNTMKHSLLSPYGYTPKVVLKHGLQNSCFHSYINMLAYNLAEYQAGSLPCTSVCIKISTFNTHILPRIMFYKPVKPHSSHLEYTTFSLSGLL